jgi:hypothetical protein
MENNTHHADVLQFILDWKISKKYNNPNRWETAVYKNIPMEYRDIPEVVQYLRENNCIARYRGPRRPGSRGKRTCLRVDATHFSIYRR